jgi:hypothetical protein
LTTAAHIVVIVAGHIIVRKAFIDQLLLYLAMDSFTINNPDARRAVQVSAMTMVCVDGFLGLPSQRDMSVYLEKMTCLGYKWQLELYPLEKQPQMKRYFS